MPINVAALVYALFSLGTARVLMVHRGLDNVGNRVLITWIALAPLAFLLAPGIAPLTFAAILLIPLMPGNPTDRVIYFVCVAPAIADVYRYAIPFPGINYLVELSYFMVTVLVVLVPLLFLRGERRAHVSWSAVDSALLGFLLYVSLMSLRDAPVTTALRNVVEQYVIYFVPYWALSRYLTSIEDLRKLARNLVWLGLILGMVAMSSTMLRWDFYQLWNVSTAPEIRNGFLRINLTMNTASLCTVLSMALVAFEYLRSENHANKIEVWVVRGLLLFAAFVTGNRGGFLQVLMTLGVYMSLMHLGSRTRSLLIVAGLAGLVSMVTAMQTIDWSQYDEQGTFQYRADLTSAAMRQIGDAPIFGEPDYVDLGHFDHLGQFNIAQADFVDVVNYYLQITLEFGLVGLAMFVFAYFAILIGLYRQHERLDPDDPLRRSCACVLAMLAPYVFVIATTSNVSLLPMLGLMILAFGRAQLRLTATRRTD